MNVVPETLKVEWNQEKYLNYSMKKPEIFCKKRYYCKDGYLCKEKHSESELMFFDYHGIGGQNFDENMKIKWETSWCKRRHFNHDEEILCTYAHDREDAYCYKCKMWNGHVASDCS